MHTLRNLAAAFGGCWDEARPAGALGLFRSLWLFSILFPTMISSLTTPRELAELGEAGIR